jgi:hypothetical protein
MRMFHRIARLVLEGLAVLALVAVAAVALGAWRFSQGPVSVSFLKPLLDGAVEEAMPGYQVELADTVLVWAGWDHGVDIRARGLRILGPRGNRFAEFEEATIRLSGRALLRGRIAPAAIGVGGPVLKLERGVDGIVRFAGQGEGEPTPGQALAPRRDDESGGESLREITISGAEIEYSDLATGAQWRARDVNLVLSRRQGLTRLDADLRVVRRDRATRLIVAARQEEGSDRIAATIGFEDVAVDLFAEFVPDGARLAGLVLPLDGRLELGIDSGGRLLDAELKIASRGGTYTDDELFPAPVVVTSLVAAGRYDAVTRRGEIETLSLAIDGGGSVDADAHISLAQGAAEIVGRAVARGVPVDALARLWPLTVGRNARSWITANLTDGQITEAQFDFALAGADPARLVPAKLSGALKFRGVSVTYLDQMPRVTGVAGSATLGLSRIEVVTNAGGIGALKLEESRTTITGLDVRDRAEIANIQIAVRGQLREQLQLLNVPRLGFLTKVGMDPASFGGEGVTRARFVLPLVGDLRMDQVSVSGTSEAKGFALKRAALGQDARDGEVQARFDEKGLTAVGKLVLGRTPAEVDYTLAFLSTAPVRERIKASGRLPAGELAAFGFDFFQPYLDGPLPISLDFVARRNGTSEVAIEAGLEAAKLTLDEIGWQKPAGQPGSAKLDVLIQRDRVAEIRNIRVAAGDADVLGRVRMAADGKSIARIELERARVGRTVLRIDATREQAAWRVQASGAALDLSDVKFDGADTPENADRPRLAVEANIQRVWIARDHAIGNVVFRGARGARWDRAQVTAVGTDRTGRSEAFTLDLTTDAAGRQRLRGRTVNAGAMLRSLGITDKIVGGEMELAGATDDGAEGRPLALDIDMRAYRMVDEPAIARFLATALITGIPDSMRGEGIGFDRLQAKALLRDSMLEIRDMRTSGPALGIQARGRIEIAADRIDMEGTIVPANAVNSLFGRIPVIGEILFGPGLFAARYTVRGPRSNPEVTINPLSALAPGVLRNIFGILEGGSAPPQGQAPRNAPAGESSP